MPLRSCDHCYSSRLRN